MFSLFFSQAPGARQHRLAGESLALFQYYSRCAEAWNPHLHQCRQAITAACRPGKKVIVLGAGWLLDIPLAALLHSYREVVLVDVVLTPALFRAAAFHPQIRLIAADLTGRLSPHHAPETVLSTAESGSYDLVISCCVVSQLSLPLLGSEKTPTRGSEEEKLKHSVEQNHLHLLRRLGSRLCLISDRDPEEESLQVHGLPEPVTSWAWLLRPLGESEEEEPVIRTVEGWIV